MKALTFISPGKIALVDKPIPQPGYGEALMNVVASGKVDLKPMVTHRFKLSEIIDAYELFASQKDGVLKVAITP